VCVAKAKLIKWPARAVLLPPPSNRTEAEKAWVCVCVPACALLANVRVRTKRAGGASQEGRGM